MRVVHKPTVNRLCSGSSAGPLSSCQELYSSSPNQYTNTPGYNRLVLGQGFTCAQVAVPAGGLHCWGAPGTGADVPADLGPVSAVAAHYLTPFACAILASTGAHRCWGRNAPVVNPAYVNGSPHWTVGVGMDFACWLRTTYRGDPTVDEPHVTCTRAGGGLVNDAGPRTVPPPVWTRNVFGDPDSAGMATRMSVGQYHACTVGYRGDDSPAFDCWGELPSQFSPPSPTLVDDVACGEGRRICAVLKGSRTVQCWSHLGDTNIDAPVDSPPVSSMSISLAAVCAVTLRSRRVVCWGNSTATTAIPPPGLPPVSALAIDKTGGCAIAMESGEVLCWGGRATNGTGADGIRTGVYRWRDFDPVPLEVRYEEDTMAGAIKQPALLFPAGLDPSVRVIPASSPGGGGQGQFAVDGLDRVAPWRRLTRAEEEQALREEGVTVYTVDRGAATVPVQAGGLCPSFDAHVPAFLPAVNFSIALADGTGYTVVQVPRGLRQSMYTFICYETVGLDVAASSMSYWDGVTVVTQYDRPSAEPAFTAPPEEVMASGTLPAQYAGIPDISTAGIEAVMKQAVQFKFGRDPVWVSAAVRAVVPGRQIRLRGEGFRLTPFSIANASDDTRQSLPPIVRDRAVVQSCVFLTWWATSAAAHNYTSCYCNGKEDWLGEGELPTQNIRSWRPDEIIFTVPPGEGIREVLVCVEGAMPGVSGRTGFGLYVIYAAPPLSRIGQSLPSTDEDTYVTLGVPAPVGTSTWDASLWGKCPAQFSRTPPDMSLPAVGGRLWLSAPLPSSERTFEALRHCTAVVVVRDSALKCARTEVPTGTGYDAFYKPPTCDALLTLATPTVSGAQVDAEGQQTTGGGLDTGSGVEKVWSVALPFPIPQAAINVSIRISIWDSGLEMSQAEEFRTVSPARPLPRIRGLQPNPLLLGPVGGVDANETGRTAELVLYGEGFRTPEEIEAASAYLPGRPRDVFVWVDDVPCTEAKVTREGVLATVRCTYPVEELGGGKHSVRLRMLGEDSVVLVNDTSTVSLSTACAAGYYGLFGVRGHQLCRPCPRGAVCAAGVGVVPMPAAGFYNLGIPPRVASSTANGSSMEDYVLQVSGVAALPGASCAPGRDDEGRFMACLAPCDPPEACQPGNVCAEGYKSVPPSYRCAVCADGYYRSSGVCVRCPVLGLQAIMIIAAVAVLSVAGVYLLSLNSIKLSTLSIVLEYVQVISLLQGPTLPWPESIQTALYALTVARANLEVAAPECYSAAIALSPETKLWLVIILPAVTLLFSILSFLFLGLAKRCLYGPDPLAGRATQDGVLKWMSKAVWRPFAHREWSHAPSVCNAALKLLTALYLPVVQSSLQVYNCTATSPDDGKTYLSIAFEECGLEGGLQLRMIPWAAAGLGLYGLLFPVCLASFYHRFSDLIIEDQLLRAAGTGDTRRSNPRAFDLRLYTSATYDAYRPGYHSAGLYVFFRKLMVCIFTLMFNKSPILPAAGVVLVFIVSMAVTASLRPLMTPETGHRAALAQFAARLEVRKRESDRMQYNQLCEIAHRTRVPVLMDLAKGKVACSDVDQAAQRWYAPYVEWNNLEFELQLQTVLVGQLSIMYNASQGTVYAGSAGAAITAAFFCLQILAMGHIGATVGYDLLLQLRRALGELLGPAGSEVADFDAPAAATGSGDDAPRVSPLSIRDVGVGHLAFLCCCPCLFTRARARAVLLQSQESADGLPEDIVSAWTSNPIDMNIGGSTGGSETRSVSKEAVPARAVHCGARAL